MQSYVFQVQVVDGAAAANFLPPQPSPSEPYPAVQLPPEPGDNDWLDGRRHSMP